MRAKRLPLARRAHIDLGQFFELSDRIREGKASSDEKDLWEVELNKSMWKIWEGAECPVDVNGYPGPGPTERAALRFRVNGKHPTPSEAIGFVRARIFTVKGARKFIEFLEARDQSRSSVRDVE